MNKSITPWIPTLITIVLGAAAASTPQAQSYLAAHPTVSALVAAAYAILKGLLPSPVAGK